MVVYLLTIVPPKATITLIRNQLSSNVSDSSEELPKNTNGVVLMCVATGNPSPEVCVCSIIHCNMTGVEEQTRQPPDL